MKIQKVVLCESNEVNDQFRSTAVSSDDCYGDTVEGAIDPIAEQSDLEELIYYLSGRLSVRKTAGQEPDRLGLEHAAVMFDRNTTSKDVPTNYTDVLQKARDADLWTLVMQSEINLSKNLNPWRPVRASTGRKVVKPKCIRDLE